MQTYEDIRILKAEYGPLANIVTLGRLSVNLRHRCKYVLVWARYGDNPRLAVLANIHVGAADPPRCGVRLVPAGYTYVYAEDPDTHIRYGDPSDWRFIDQSRLNIENRRVVYYEPGDLSPFVLTYEDTGEVVVLPEGNHNEPADPLHRIEDIPDLEIEQAF